MMFSAGTALALLAAAASSFVFGALWYSLLARPRMAATGKTEADIRGRDDKGPAVLPFILAFVAQFGMAFVFAIFMLRLDDVAVFYGMTLGLWFWLGFVVTTLVVNHGFQGASWKLTLIDGGHWLGVLIIQGAVLGALLTP